MVQEGIPAMIGSRKVHKVGWEAGTGPPTHPIINAKLGPNAGMGNLISRIIRPLRKEINNIGTTLASTEELLRAIENFNRGVPPNLAGTGEEYT